MSTVFVDPLFYFPSRDPRAFAVGAKHGHLWSHLWSDDLKALHRMANALGIRRFFQDKPGFPHYDLVPPRRAKALLLGAVEMDLATWLREQRDRDRLPTPGEPLVLPGLESAVGAPVSPLKAFLDANPTP